VLTALRSPKISYDVMWDSTRTAALGCCGLSAGGVARTVQLSDSSGKHHVRFPANKPFSHFNLSLFLIIHPRKEIISLEMYAWLKNVDTLTLLV
jgi:hypothetical protein